MVAVSLISIYQYPVSPGMCGGHKGDDVGLCEPLATLVSPARLSQQHGNNREIYYCRPPWDSDEYGSVQCAASDIVPYSVHIFFFC